MDELLLCIGKIMGELSGIIKSVNLRKTTLSPIKSNSTRWSSSFEMLKRFFDIFPHMDMNDKVIKYLSPNNKEFNDLEKLFQDLT